MSFQKKKISPKKDNKKRTHSGITSPHSKMEIDQAEMQLQKIRKMAESDSPDYDDINMVYMMVENLETDHLEMEKGIDVSELREKCKDMPEWAIGFAAYLTNSITEKLAAGINHCLDKNFANIKQVNHSLRSQIEQLEQEQREYTASLNSRLETSEAINKELEHENTELKRKIVEQEQQSRRSNLVVSGIPELENEDLFKWFSKCCYNSLHLDQPIMLERIHRLGTKRTNTRDGYPRPIIMKFSFFQDRQAVWASKWKLKGTRIMLSEDYAPEITEARKRLLPIASEAKRQGMKASVSKDKLIVNGYTYAVNNLIDLPSSLRPISNSQRESETQISFFRKHSVLSNHHPKQHTLNQVTYNCNEQYFVSTKCEIYGHHDAAKVICDSTDAGEMVQIAKVCQGTNEKFEQKKPQ